MDGKKTLSRIERVLQDHAALPQLQALAAAGCDRVELIAALDLSFLADESWETLVDMDLRAFKRAIAQIRDCAGMIDRLNCSHLMHHLSLETRDPRFVGLHASPTLPEQLRVYANLLDSVREERGPDHPIGRNTWKAWVVAIVTQDTKRPHDREVSSLIAAILDDSKYSESAHREWRLKHKDGVKMMRKILQDHRRKRALQSISL